MSASDHSILEQASGWLQEGRKVAIATVVETWGSAPQPVGSQLVIDAEGNFIGSVSGGCVEGAVVTEAVDIIASGKPKLLAVRRRRRDGLAESGWPAAAASASMWSRWREARTPRSCSRCAP